MIISKKLIFLFLISLAFGQNLHALQTHQIMRKIEQDGREESERKQKQQRTELRKIVEKEKKKKHIPAFHIHEEIICTGAEESPEGLAEIVRKTRFSKAIIERSPLHFSMMTEVIKAHLYIAEMFYGRGRFINSNQLRFHTSEERFFYPDDVLKDLVYDVYKSPLYIKYVIMPVIEPYMTKKEFEDTHLHLDFVRNPAELPTGKRAHKYIKADGTQQHFKYYKAHIDVLIQRFDNVRKRHFMNRPLDQHMIALTSVALYHHAWQAYKNISMCPRYTKIIDPAVEAGYMSLPDYHDTYVMGYGLLARAEDLIGQRIRTSGNLSEDERQYLLKVMQDFRNLYADIIMDNEKRISYTDFEKNFTLFKQILKKRFIP